MGNATNEIVIREFKKEDYKQVKDIMQHSFKNKFQVSSINEEKLSLLIEDSGIVNTEAFEGYYIAELEKEVVGVLLLKWKDQKRKKNIKHISFVDLCVNFGFFKIIKLFLGFMFLTEKPKSGDLYIDHIAVSSKARGKGVGTKLLSEAEELVRKTDEFNRLTLFVASKNTNAIHVYEKVGFSITKEYSSFITKYLFNERKWYFMSKQIKSVAGSMEKNM